MSAAASVSPVFNECFSIRRSCIIISALLVMLMILSLSRKPRVLAGALTGALTRIDEGLDDAVVDIVWGFMLLFFTNVNIIVKRGEKLERSY